MSGHTPEPWVANGGAVCAIDEGIWSLLEGTSEHDDENEANARRIVACVNACAGILTELIESFDGTNDIFSSWKAQQRELTALRQQVADLRTALIDATARLEDLLYEPPLRSLDSGPGDLVNCIATAVRILAATQPQEVQP